MRTRLLLLCSCVGPMAGFGIALAGHQLLALIPAALAGICIGFLADRIDRQD